MSWYYYENCFHDTEPLKGSGEPAGSRLHFENLRLTDSLNIVECVVCVQSGQMGTRRLREGKDLPAVSLEGHPAGTPGQRPALCSWQVFSVNLRSSYKKGSECLLRSGLPHPLRRGLCESS